jgi:hypothetical protein
MARHRVIQTTPSQEPFACTSSFDRDVSQLSRHVHVLTGSQAVEEHLTGPCDPTMGVTPASASSAMYDWAVHASLTAGPYTWPAGFPGREAPWGF